MVGPSCRLQLANNDFKDKYNEPHQLDHIQRIRQTKPIYHLEIDIEVIHSGQST